MPPDVVVAALRSHPTRQRMERLVAGSRWVDSGYVFTTLLGKPMHGATVTRAFQTALERAGLSASVVAGVGDTSCCDAQVRWSTGMIGQRIPRLRR